METARVLAVLLAALAAGCARQEAPPGAVPESVPPDVKRLFPPMDTIVPELRDPARVEFTEPVQGLRGIERQLVASPAYRYVARAGHGDLRIRPEEGWRAGAVYRIVLPPGISDLLGNRREDSIRLRFSTGPPITATRVRGTFWDRVTGERVTDARMLLLSVDGDSVPYTAVADTGGRFALEAAPPDAYRAFGFVDRNGDLRVDRRLEPYDSASVTLEGSESDTSVTFVLVEPDSTPPVLVRARARDSLRVWLEFDDYLRAARPSDTVDVAIRRGDPEEAWPVSGVRVLSPGDTLAGERAPPADTAARDTAAAPADTAEAAERDTLAAPADTAGPPSPVGPLPTRLLEVQLGRPLVEDTFTVSVRGAVNLRGLAGAGDTLLVYTPPPDTAGASRGEGPSPAPDSLDAPADTSASGAAGPSRPRGPRDALPTGGWP